jgi:hypothetical protein
MHNVSSAILRTHSWQTTVLLVGLVYGVYRHFQQDFRYIVVVSFIGAGNRSTRRKQQACRKSLTKFITYCCIEYTSPRTGLELTTLVVIGTDCTCIVVNPATIRSRPLGTGTGH